MTFAAERARLIDKQEFEAECEAVRRRALQYSKQRRKEERQRIQRWIETPIEEIVTSGHNAEQRERIRLKRTTGRKPTLYTINGEAKSISEWALVAGVCYNTMRTRLERLNGSPLIGDAISNQPCDRTVAVHTIDGVSKTLHQWAEHLGISYNALCSRMREGRTLADAVAMNAGYRIRPANSGRQPKLYTANGVSKTLQQWADHLGISYGALARRLEKRTLAEALAMPAGRHPKKGPGVSSDLEAFEGTGAGRNPRDSQNITFEETAE